MPKLDPARTTAFGMWRYGNDFLNAADSLAKNQKIGLFIPYYFLLGQSIELSLKAFLLGRGTTLKDLKDRYGHDLTKLLKEARRRKLGNEVPLSQVQCGVVRVLARNYKDRRFQYIETGTMTLPDPQIIDGVTQTLSNGLKDFCYRATYGDGI